MPPTKKELFNRLLKRDQKDKNIASIRMKQFKKDVMYWKDYDFAVINDKVEECYKQIISFINKKKQKRYDISITYDKYYRTPRIWFLGTDENDYPIPNNKVLIEKARQEAQKIICDDPDLKKHNLLKNLLKNNYENKFVHDFLN